MSHSSVSGLGDHNLVNISYARQQVHWLFTLPGLARVLRICFLYIRARDINATFKMGHPSTDVAIAPGMFAVVNGAAARRQELHQPLLLLIGGLLLWSLGYFFQSLLLLLVLLLQTQTSTTPQKD
jgi:hypothetical protein